MLHSPRRLVVIAVLLLSVPVLSPMATSAATSVAAERPSLDQPPLAQRGDRSRTVRQMQQQLVRAGISLRGGADGVFGAATETAVRQFQTRRGLTVNGVLDVPTAIVLGLIKGTPLVARGARGDAVKVMQEQLVAVGLPLRGGVDGVFGSSTASTLKAFQRSKGLVASGTFDAGTASILANAVAALQPPTTVPTAPSPSTLPPTTTVPPTTTTVPPTTTTVPPTSTTVPNAVLLSIGSRGAEVRAMQSQLIAVGISVFGGADGVFGNATQTALKAFQTRAALPASGVFDTVTKAALIAAQPVAPPTTTPPTTAPPTTTPPTSAPPTTSPSNVVLLTLGSRGEEVRTMQSQLIAVGITVFGGADGVFGSATQSALRAFQTGAGLPVNGVFDTVTKAGLVAAQPTSPPPPPSPVVLAAFPVAPSCAFADTYGAPRSGGRSHQGVDIIVGSGTPIYAVMDGTISRKQIEFAGSLGGNALWLTAADGTYFYYAHLSAFAPGIELGSAVTAGQLIGYVGMTGNASVPHLHFEVHPNGGSAVNPYPVVKAASNCTK